MKTSVTIETPDSFFEGAKTRLRMLREGKKLPAVNRIVFEDADDLIRFMGSARMAVYRAIRDKHAATYKELEMATSRRRATLRADIEDLEKLGLIEQVKVDNPGHGKKTAFISKVDGPVTIEATV